MNAANPYYPPRANWISRWRRPWLALRREIDLNKIRTFTGLSLKQIFAGLVLPGYGPYACGRRLTGRCVASVWLICVFVFLVELGRTPSHIACGIAISLHVTSILYLLRQTTDSLELPKRLLVSLLVVFCVTQLVYSPARRQLERHFAWPVQKAGTTIIINPTAAPGPVNRGDWIAYRTVRHGSAVRVAAGLNLEPVLAVAGDRVVFHADRIEVNGISHPRQAMMPAQGELVVPAGCWFIWPNFTVTNNYHANIASELLACAVVSSEDFVGKPYQRWFWRRQKLA